MTARGVMPPRSAYIRMSESVSERSDSARPLRGMMTRRNENENETVQGGIGGAEGSQAAHKVM